MSASRMREHLATYEHKARCLRDEAAAADAKCIELRASIEACERAERAARAAEEDIRTIPVHTSDGRHAGDVQVILGPWFMTARRARRRLVGVGREGRLLACYELSPGGPDRLRIIHGSTPTAVDLALSRAFSHD